MLEATSSIGRIKDLRRTPTRGDALRLRGADYFVTATGPNSTTFVCAAEIFPFRRRTTPDGIAAAAGKLGDFFGVFLFRILRAAMGSSRRKRLRRSSAFSGDRDADDVAGKVGKGLEELKVEAA
jgi:hypothetical protein